MNGADRIRLVYATDASDEVELPFRILVLGDFLPGRPPDDWQEWRRPLRIDARNFNAVLAAQHVRLRLRLENHALPGSGDPLDLECRFRAMGDFSPDALANAVPPVRETLQLADRLIDLKNAGGSRSFSAEALPPFQKTFLSALGFENRPVPPESFDAVIAEIRIRAGKQLDALLHHADFVRLESAWRGLHFMVNRLKPGENCFVDILCIGKETAEEDFEEWKEIFGSFLYQKIYSEELGQFGGKPYGAILADYEFDRGPRDMKLLKNFAHLARVCHAPFLGNVSPSFFGLDRMAELAGVRNLREQLDHGLQYEKWRTFRRTETARYAGLLLPRFILRNAYDHRNGDVRRFPYIEESFSLWGAPVFAFGVCLLNSFVKHRWCLNVIGPEGGKVTGLSWVKDNALEKKRRVIPIQVLLSEQKEAELANAGFIPLTIHKGDDYAAFYSANSVKEIQKPRWDRAKSGVNDILDAQLPYLFVVCRLAHYLKVIQRDNIGTSKSMSEMQSELTKWLMQYVSDMDSPALAVRAKRPLRSVRLDISDESAEGRKNWYHMRLRVTPHFRYMGSVFSLSLDGELDAGE